MSSQKYTPLAADPGTAHTCPCGTTRKPHWARRRSVWLLIALGLETLLLLGIAYRAALYYAPSSSHQGNSTGLLDPQSFLPPSRPPMLSTVENVLTLPVPLQTVIFEDGTPYRDIGPAGDKLWNDMMPSTAAPIQTHDITSANTLIKRGKASFASQTRASMTSRPASQAATAPMVQRSSPLP